MQKVGKITTLGVQSKEISPNTVNLLKSGKEANYLQIPKLAFGEHLGEIYLTKKHHQVFLGW